MALYLSLLSSTQPVYFSVGWICQGKVKHVALQARTGIHAGCIMYWAPLFISLRLRILLVSDDVQSVCARVCVCDGGEQDLHSPFIGKWVTDNKHLLSYIELCFDWTMIIFFYSDISLYQCSQLFAVSCNSLVFSMSLYYVVCHIFIYFYFHYHYLYLFKYFSRAGSFSQHIYVCFGWPSTASSPI